MILILIVVALLKSHLNWEGVRRLLHDVGDLPSLVNARLLYLKKELYEAFYETTVNKESIDYFFTLVGYAIKTALYSDAWSVILTPKNSDWRFIAWDKKYDKRDLDAAAPYIQESGGARIAYEKREVVDIPNTMRQKRWREIDELMARKGFGEGETKSWIGVPVVVGREVVAVISVDWFRPRGYKPWMVDLLREFSKDISKVVGSIRDIVDLMRRIDYEPTLGIAGRRALEEEFRRLKEEGKRIGIILVKIENLERVRKIYGQSVRNDLAREAVRRLKDSFGDRAKMFSISLDTIVIILENIVPTMLPSYQRKVLNEFLRIFGVQKEGRTLFMKLQARVGYAVYPDDSEDLEGLLSVALKRGVLH